MQLSAGDALLGQWCHWWQTALPSWQRWWLSATAAVGELAGAEEGDAGMWKAPGIGQALSCSWPPRSLITEDIGEGLMRTGVPP